MVDGLDGRGGVLVETVDSEEYLWSDGLLAGGNVLVEGCHLVIHLDGIVVGYDATIVQFVVDLIVFCYT